MGKTLLLMLTLSLLAAPVCANSAINPLLQAYLSTYIGNAVINGSTYYNQTVGSNSYIIMQVNSTEFTKFVIIDATSLKYSLVTSNAVAFNVLSPMLTSMFYPSEEVLDSLNTSMRLFTAQSDPGLNSCLFQTGLTYYMCDSSTPLLTCMESSCAHVLMCGGTQKSPASALTQFGIPSPFAYGVQNFSIAYLALNSSYNRYFSLLSGINTDNYQTNINGLISALASITSITSTIQNNPVFPPPSNITVSQATSICSGYIPPKGPWWCYAIGYCEGTTFNSSTLTGLGSQLSALKALPVSSAAIRSVAANSTALAYGYQNKVIASQKTVIFNNLMSSLLPIYNSTVANATTLASRINNATLSQSLQNLKSTFAVVRSLGANQDLTVANQTIRSLIGNVSSMYAQINSAYGGIFSLASDNTRNIIAKELDFRTVPISLANLASKQELLNARLNGGINVSMAVSILAGLKAVQSGLAFTFSPLSAASIVKVFDGGIISAILSGSNAPMASKLSGGAAYAAIISLVIAVVLLSAFYLLVYRRLGRKHKIKLNHRVRKAWRALFAALLVIAVVYVALTYAYASSATTFLPFSGFLSALKGGSTVYIAYNSTADSSILSCASALKSSLTALGKSVDTISLSGYSCESSSDPSLAGTECLDGILSSSKPLIIMGQGSNSSIIYKGLYGRVLYATGSAASGRTCTLNTVLNYK